MAMKNNKIFDYYIRRNDTKSAGRIKNAFYRYDMPHQKAIRRERRLKQKFESLKLNGYC